MCGNALRCFFLLVLFLSPWGVAQAQFGTHPFPISEKNGLSDDNITCIYRDHQHFFWVGTNSGLNLIDGAALRVFKSIPGDKTSISGNEIHCILEDDRGRLWVGTNRGLNEYEPGSRSFRRIAFPGDEDQEPVIDMATYPNRGLYLAMPGGLIHFDPETQKQTSLVVPGAGADKFYSNHITHLAFDASGLLYLASFNGVWRYEPKTRLFTHLISHGVTYTCMAFDHRQHLWLGTWDQGLEEWDPVQQKLTRYRNYDSSDAIRALTEIRIPAGYRILSNTQILNPELPQGNAIHLPDARFRNAQAICFNPGDGRLWLGTGKGLFLYSSQPSSFRYHNFSSPITAQNVSILEWENQYLVGGSGTHFLRRYDRNFQETENYSGLFAQQDLECLALCRSGKNQLSCGTSNGIAVLDFDTRRVAFHKLKDTGAHSPQLDFIDCLFKARDSTWWIFPWRNGVWLQHAGEAAPHKVFNNFLSSFGRPKPLVVSGACEDGQGNIWMSDFDEGIILYQKKDKRFSKPFADSLGPHFSCSQILYRDGYCYSFVSNALLYWEAARPLLHRVPLLPLRDKTINSIALDPQGRVWMATQNGLLAYVPKQDALLHFTIADGLPRNEMDGSLYAASDGRMVFGCPDYLFSFEPEELLRQVPKKPSITLVQVLVNGSPYRFQGAPDFPHSANNFLFRWAVTDYTDPLHNRYYYMLEGLDKGWRNAGSAGEAEFANLSPGRYTLLLKGENSNGVPAARILKLQFEIRPPFWDTWWFFTLLFLAVSAFFYAFYKYRLQQHLRLELLRNKISLNLHDEIGSSLSSISILSEMALHRVADPPTQKMIEEIRDNSIVMMERMDDIVWSINPKNDTLEELLVRIRTFAGKLFEAREINYTIQIDDRVHRIALSMEKRQHIYLILKEAINNLIKYSACTEAGIDVAYQAPWLRIRIWDNGKGFEPAQAHRGNGIFSMKSRAAALKAGFELRAKPQEGTELKLTVKIK